MTALPQVFIHVSVSAVLFMLYLFFGLVHLCLEEIQGLLLPLRLQAAAVVLVIPGAHIYNNSGFAIPQF